jgi:hypothetical protein
LTATRRNPILKELEIPIQEFLTQFDDRDILVIPNPDSKEQVELSTSLGSAITAYQHARISHEAALKAAARRLREDVEHMTKGTDSNVVEQEVWEEVLSIIDFRDANKTLEARVNDAVLLLQCINAVKAHGMVHDGQGLSRKLRECQADNAKLSAQILDYKKRLINPSTDRKH